jgi:hypothetical protein
MRFETEIIENVLVRNDYVQERNDCVKIYVSKPLNISFSYSLRIILTIDYISLPICSEKQVSRTLLSWSTISR